METSPNSPNNMLNGDQRRKNVQRPNSRMGSLLPEADVSPCTGLVSGLGLWERHDRQVHLSVSIMDLDKVPIMDLDEVGQPGGQNPSRLNSGLPGCRAAQRLPCKQEL